MTDQEAMAVLDNAPVAFGLESQGHIPTIQRMLKDGQPWTEIGKQIGWWPLTAFEHYEQWCERRKRAYRALLPAIREAARTCGYAIAVHGSEVRDFDLVAIPWADDAMCHEVLANAVKVAAGGKILPAFSMVAGDTQNKNPSLKPHGRMVWTILLSEGDNPKFIDLSVMPLSTAQVTAKLEGEL